MRAFYIVHSQKKWWSGVIVFVLKINMAIKIMDNETVSQHTGEDLEPRN